MGIMSVSLAQLGGISTVLSSCLVLQFLGYAAFYMTRLSLGYAAPSMIEDPTLGLDMKGVGGFTSILPTCYGISKFASGVLGANTSPTYLLAGNRRPTFPCVLLSCTQSLAAPIQSGTIASK